MLPTRFLIRRTGSLRRLFSSDSTISLDRVRNIGISAHVDSGKTTLSERVLYYTGRIEEIHEIQGKDGVGAKMDHMELERERGITITSAATSCLWDVESDILSTEKSAGQYYINLIDTPGHVDFTIEVERALRVLDGAVMLVCGVKGVQSQTLTVDRQMTRYEVPRLVFINKLDRAGSDPFRAIADIRKKLNLKMCALQVPIGSEKDLLGVVDVIGRRPIFFEGEKGQKRRAGLLNEVPVSVSQRCEEVRSELIEHLTDVDDIFAEKVIDSGEEALAEPDFHQAIRRATIKRTFVPVLMGSAYKNKGVQPLLDAVCAYLPAPADREQVALNVDKDELETKLDSGNTSKPFVGMVFKIQDLPGQGNVSYIRIYQGKLKKGDQIVDMRNRGKKMSIKRLLRMHSNEVKDIAVAGAGDIVGVTGVECDSGSTITDGKSPLVMNSMFVPDPVVSLSIKLNDRLGDPTKFTKALNRFKREDPTFRVHFDDSTKETIVAGMGELHLEVYAERIRREYGLNVVTGEPKVNYRETITARADFDYTHKKQTGGRGQYGKIVGYIEPIPDDEVDPNKPIQFLNQFSDPSFNQGFFNAIQKGFFECAAKGLLTGSPCINMRFVMTDGKAHEVDSSELAFKLAAQGCFEQAFPMAGPKILEPLMKVQVYAPCESQTQVITSLTSRQGAITDATAVSSETSLVEANVPLRTMFGYISDLRAVTQGHGEYSMEFLEYAPMPSSDQDTMVAKINRK
jgi:elongation factor G